MSNFIVNGNRWPIGENKELTECVRCGSNLHHKRNSVMAVCLKCGTVYSICENCDHYTPTMTEVQAKVGFSLLSKREISNDTKPSAEVRRLRRKINRLLESSGFHLRLSILNIFVGEGNLFSHTNWKIF